MNFNPAGYQHVAATASLSCRGFVVPQTEESLRHIAGAEATPGRCAGIGTLLETISQIQDQKNLGRILAHPTPNPISFWIKTKTLLRPTRANHNNFLSIEAPEGYWQILQSQMVQAERKKGKICAPGGASRHTGLASAGLLWETQSP